MERDDTVLSAEEKDQQGELREKLRVVKTVLEQVPGVLGEHASLMRATMFSGAGSVLSKYHAKAVFKSVFKYLVQ